ncbi:MAG TPA: Rpn family recombination-promoting nuclease/putative transposase [Thermoanaerobaculia bacterium]|nr:Rpn family recombination-promoting nuclease/putative transposase [Thermoanaerobaculia bacterium]
MAPQCTQRRGNGSEHDSGYKLLFSHPRMVEELCRGFLPVCWNRRHLPSMEMAPTNFVSDGHQERRADLVWRLRWHRGGDTYLLLELQSTPDPSMPVRMLTYAGLLLQRLIREGVLKSRGALPTVLPVVLYLGKPPWRTPLDVISLFGAPSPVAKRFLPQLHYVLLDARRIDLERPELADNLVAALLRVEICEAPEDFPSRVRHALGLLSRQEDPGLRRTVTNWLRQKFHRVASGGIIVPGLEDTEMLEQTLMRWERQFRVDGMRQMLVRVMEERFGPLPPAVHQSLEKVRNARTLEKLAGKILRAESLAQVGLGA